MTPKQRITDDIMHCAVNDCECCDFCSVGDREYCQKALICAAALIMDANDDDRAD